MDHFLTGTQLNFNPTAVEKANNFDGGFDRQPTQGRNLNPFHQLAYSTRDYTAISGQLHFLVAELVKELVLVDARVEPFTNRISPFLFTPELNITKNKRLLIPTLTPIVPHLGAFHNTRIRQETVSGRQVRRGLAVEQEISALNTPEGRRDLQDLILGASQNVLRAFVNDVVSALIGAAQPIQSENDRRRRLANMQQNKPRGQAQKTAVRSIFNTQIRQYAIMTKERLSLDVMVNAAKKRIKALGNTADTIVMGTGVKVRIFDTDKDRIFFFRAGPSGPLLRLRGSEEIDTYKGLGIVEVNPPHPDSGMRSLAEREVEVGEFYPMLKNKCSNGATFHPNHRRIQIFNEETDSWAVICLSDVIGPSGVFDADTGELADSHQEMANDYNRGGKGKDTEYRRNNQIADNKIITPEQYSMFLYEDDNDMAQVANLWGQLSHKKVFKSKRAMKEMALSTLAGLGLSQVAQSELSNGLETGVRLLTQIANEPFNFDHWKRTRWFNMEGNTLDRVKRNEVGRITDARGNNRGSLNYQGGAQASVGNEWGNVDVVTTGFQAGLGAGFGNGAGIRELSRHFISLDQQRGENSIYGMARVFLNAVERIVAFLQRAVKRSHALRTGAAWFHQSTPATTFIDNVFAAFELPVWMRVADNQRDAQEATLVVNLAAPNRLLAAANLDAAAFLASVDTALTRTPPAAFNGAATLAVLLKLAELGRIDDGNASVALDLFHSILANSRVDIQNDDTGLGLLDVRFSSAIRAIAAGNIAGAADGRGSVEMVGNIVATVSSLMQDNDISPAAFRRLKAEKKKKKKKGADDMEEESQPELASKKMETMRALIAWAYQNRTNVDAQIRLNEVQGRQNGAELKKWFSGIKREFKERADSILNEAFQADPRFRAGVVGLANQAVNSWVRTPLTASANTVEELRVAFLNQVANNVDAAMDVSNALQTYTRTAGNGIDMIQNTVHGVRGRAAIGRELLETDLFKNLEKLQRGVNGADGGMDTRGEKRARRYDEEEIADAYADSGAGVGGGFGKRQARQTTNSRIDAELDSFLDNADDAFASGASRMDVDAEFESDDGIGAQWPSRVAREHVRGDPSLGIDAMDMDDDDGMGGTRRDRGMFYQRFQNRDFFENWKAARRLGALERSVMMAILLTPISFESAVDLADNTDALFGALLFRPHIRHIMTGVWILKAGMDTMFTPFSGTDSRWSMDGQAGLITFTPTWHSTSMVINNQWIIAYHDVAPVGPDAYQSGNDVQFFDKRKGVLYDLKDGSTPASIYAVIVPAIFEPATEIDMTGAFQMSYYDKSAPSAVIPQYDGAPWASKHWGFNRYVQKTHQVGFEDRRGNTLTFRGRYNISDGASAHNFNVEIANTGHWGETKPGKKKFRNGSAIVE